MTLEKECSNDSHKAWEFWRLCAIVQVRELEVDLLNGDYQHAMKELVDMSTVAADAIRHMGGEYWSTLTERIVENAQKSGVFDRDEAFYRAKLAKEEGTIVGLGGKLTETPIQAVAEAQSRRAKRCNDPECGLCRLVT